MKVFTSLMKTLITIVSLALTVMLIMTAAPLVMGGIEVENTEEITVTQNGSNLDIEGVLTVKSSLPKDITDLTISIDAVSTKEDGLKGVNIWNYPARTVKQGSEAVIDIDASVNIAEVIVFLLADTGDKKGIYLPIQISISAEYGGLAGFEMEVISIVELSKEGQISSSVKMNDAGKAYSATAEFTGTDGDMILDLIPDGGLDARLYVEGSSLDSVDISINKDGNRVSVTINTGDDPATAIGIIDLAKQMIDDNGIVHIEAVGGSVVVPEEQMKEIKNYLDIYLGGIENAA